MKHAGRGRPAAAQGPSQRQLRAGELVRHALAEILREEDLSDPALEGVSVTVTEVRMSPDLRHATCFVEPLGAGIAGVDLRGTGTGIAGPDLRGMGAGIAGPDLRGMGAGVAGAGVDAAEVVAGLNRVAKFLRGQLGRQIELKFTPALRFLHDETFDEAARMARLFARPEVQRDLRLSDVVDDESEA